MNLLKKSLQYIIPLVVGVFIFYQVYEGQDFDTMLEKLSKADYTWVGMSLMLTIIAHFIRAYRWNMIIEPLGYKPTLMNSFYALMAGYLANLALPRAGEVVRCGLLSRHENMPLDKTFGTVISERIVDLITLASLLGISILLEYNLLRDLFFDEIIPSTIEKFAFLGLGSFWLIAFVLMIVFAVLTYMVMKRYRDHAIVLKIKTTIKGFWEGIKAIKDIKGLGLYLVLTVLMWGCYYMMAYLCTFSLEATSGLSLIAGLSLLTIGSLGIAAPVQGGMGTYHYMVATLLVIYGISFEDGALVAFVIHSSQTLFVIVVGFISLFAISYFSKKQSSDEPS